MILVDTSVWIELLNGSLGSRVSEKELLNFATCGPVVQEVLQGLGHDPASEAFREGLLALPILSDPLPMPHFYRRPRFIVSGRQRATRFVPPPIA